MRVKVINKRPASVLQKKRVCAYARVSTDSRRQEESRSMSENNKWSIRKKFERGEVMITTSRFLGYDKNEYGDLIVNRKEAEIVSLTFAFI